MATFLFVDYFAFNYVLAAIITYLLNLVRRSPFFFLLHTFIFVFSSIDCHQNTFIIRSKKSIEKNINSKDFSHLNV